MRPIALKYKDFDKKQYSNFHIVFEIHEDITDVHVQSHETLLMKIDCVSFMTEAFFTLSHASS